MDRRELISQLELILKVVDRLIQANPESQAYSVNEWGYRVTKEGVEVVYSERDTYDYEMVHARTQLIPWDHIDDPEPVIAAYNLAKEAAGKANAAAMRDQKERLFEQLKKELGK